MSNSHDWQTLKLCKNSRKLVSSLDSASLKCSIKVQLDKLWGSF